jgi:hypothetical protein
LGIDVIIEWSSKVGVPVKKRMTLTKNATNGSSNLGMSRICSVCKKMVIITVAE